MMNTNPECYSERIMTFSIVDTKFPVSDTTLALAVFAGKPKRIRAKMGCERKRGMTSCGDLMKTLARFLPTTICNPLDYNYLQKSEF